MGRIVGLRYCVSWMDGGRKKCKSTFTAAVALTSMYNKMATPSIRLQIWHPSERLPVTEHEAAGAQDGRVQNRRCLSESAALSSLSQNWYGTSRRGFHLCKEPFPIWMNIKTQNNLRNPEIDHQGFTHVQSLGSDGHPANWAQWLPTSSHILFPVLIKVILTRRTKNNLNKTPPPKLKSYLSCVSGHTRLSRLLQSGSNSLI